MRRTRRYGGLSTRSSSADFDLFRGGAGRFVGLHLIRCPGFLWDPALCGPRVATAGRALCPRSLGAAAVSLRQGRKPAAAVRCSAQYAGHGTAGRNRPRCPPRTAPRGSAGLLCGRLGGDGAIVHGCAVVVAAAAGSAVGCCRAHQAPPRVWAQSLGAAAGSTHRPRASRPSGLSHVHPGDAAPQRSPRPRARAATSCPGGDPSARTTATRGPPRPQVARTDPTWRSALAEVFRPHPRR